MTPGDIEDLLLAYEADVAVWTRTPDKYNYAEVVANRKKIADLLEARTPQEATGLQCEKDGVCALVSRNDDEWHCTACNGDFVRKQPVEPGGWRPIKTAPKKGRFMVWIPATDLAWPAYAGGDWIYSNAHGALNEMQDGRVLTATHWMPLPSAPVTKGETP